MKYIKNSHIHCCELMIARSSYSYLVCLTWHVVSFLQLGYHSLYGEPHTPSRIRICVSRIIDRAVDGTYRKQTDLSIVITH